MIDNDLRKKPTIIQLIVKILDISVIIGGSGILLLTFINVVFRFTTNSDVAWSTELIVLLMIWTTFLGAARATAALDHMRIGELLAIIPEPWQSAAEILAESISLVLLLALAWWGWSISMSSMVQYTTVLRIPIGIQYLSLPVSSAISIIFLINIVFKRIARIRSSNSKAGQA